MDKEKFVTYFKMQKELKHREATSKDEPKLLFRHTCVNAYPARNLHNSNEPMNYRRNDLSQWAKDAFDKGKNCFYAEPVDPKEPYGKLRLCEPKYEYKQIRNLSETEFAMLFEK